MGTTSEKLTYLNGTKQLLKDKINNLGGSIDDNTTFRQYANQLQGVYDNLPKTEYQEGTEVNLGKTLKGKLDFDNGVVGIGQSSQNTTTGKNLLNYNDLTQIAVSNGFTVDVDGNIKDITPDADGRSWNYSSSNWQMTLPPGTYTFTFYFSVQATNEYCGAVITDDLGNGIAGFSDFKNTDRVSKSFTLSSQTNIGILTKLFDAVCKVQLESGSTAHDWEKYTGGQASPNPSYPQTINSVTGNQDVVVSGKNILNPSNVIHAVYGGSVGTTGNLSGYDNSFTTWIEMKPNQTYVFSGNLSNVNSNVVRAFVTNSEVTIGTSVTRVNNLSNGGTYTNTSGYKYLVLEFLDIAEYEGNWQVEEGSSATSYEPYVTPKTYQFSLGDHKFYGIGTYRDYILRTTGKNLFDSEIEQGGYYANGSPSESNNLVRTKDLMQIYDVNSNYVFSNVNNLIIDRVLFFDSSQSVISRSDSLESAIIQSSIIPSNTKYIKLTIRKSNFGTLTPSELINPMLEEGSTASDYQPYGVGVWYKYGEVGEILLDGTNQSFSGKSGFTTNHVFFTLPISDILAPPNNDTDVNMLSNYFLHCKINALASNRIGFGCRSDKMLGFGFTLESQLDTLEKANTWLTTHNIDVLYPLAIPTIDIITGTLAEQLEEWYNAQSLNGTTIITSNGNLPMIIKARGLKGE